MNNVFTSIKTWYYTRVWLWWKLRPIKKAWARCLTLPKDEALKLIGEWEDNAQALTINDTLKTAWLEDMKRLRRQVYVLHVLKKYGI